MGYFSDIFALRKCKVLTLEKIFKFLNLTVYISFVLQFDLKRLQEVEANLKKQLQAEKEKSYILEQSMNDLLRKGMNFFIILKYQSL